MVSVNELAQQCSKETERFLHRQSYDDQFCFELFRRAILEKDQLAWEAVYLQYQPMVRKWVQTHPSFIDVSGEDVEYFVNRTFEKFWAVMISERFFRFTELKSLLRFLKMCVHGAISDHIREQTKQFEVEDEASFEEQEQVPTIEDRALSQIDQQKFWNLVNARINDERELMAIYGSFVLNLKPAEIHEQLPKEFSSADEIYRVLRNFLGRLRQDREFLLELSFAYGSAGISEQFPEDRIRADKNNRVEQNILSRLLRDRDFLKELSGEAEEPPTRYADFTFFYVDDSNPAPIPDKQPLRAGQWYKLEVAVRVRPVGISPVEPVRRPIREPAQESDVIIMVAIESEMGSVEVEIAEPVQTLILPTSGDSKQNAYFQLRPLRKSTNTEDLARMRVRLYYEFNLLEVIIISAEVISGFVDPSRSQLGLERPLSFKQERLEREYLDFNHIQPRTMNIDITRLGNHFTFNFTFRNAVDEKIVFTAPARLAITDLEDELTQVRKIWYDIALSKSFSEHLEGDKNEFLINIWKLAKAGQGLWVKLFKQEQGSAIYKVGQWLERHPLETGGIIQITFQDQSASFVFPWSLLYDRSLPKKDYELPDLEGFWGIRYCIEQQLPSVKKGSDEPVQTQNGMKLGFVLWESFRNANQVKSLLEHLVEKSQNKLVVTKPPITDAEECYRYLDQCDAHILYFYTHGYTRLRKADLSVGTNLDLFIKRYEALDASDPNRKTYSMFYDSIKQNSAELDRSYIELSAGKLYLDELYKQIEKLESRPLVILNMCESAQVTPSLSDSFIHFFLNRGACSVIGTECPMTVEFAHPFAQEFLLSLLSGKSAGVVLLAVRRRFLELSNPLGLAYTLYGRVTARFEPPVISS